MIEESDRNKEDEARLDQHVRDIQEHWDNVRIFVSRDGDKRSITQELSRGSGNWYAQYGQIKLWCERQEAYERHYHCKERDKEEGNESY